MKNYPASEDVLTYLGPQGILKKRWMSELLTSSGKLLKCLFQMFNKFSGSVHCQHLFGHMFQGSVMKVS